MERKFEVCIGQVEDLQLTSSGKSYKFQIRGDTFYTKNPKFSEGDTISFEYTESTIENGMVFKWISNTKVNSKGAVPNSDSVPLLPKQKQSMDSISFREHLILRQNALNWAVQLYNPYDDEDLTFVEFVKEMFEEVWGIPWSLTEPSK